MPLFTELVAEKLKASQDEGAEVQKDEEEYHYHDGHQYEVGSTHNIRPSVAYFLPTDTLSLPIGLPSLCSILHVYTARVTSRNNTK